MEKQHCSRMGRISQPLFFVQITTTLLLIIYGGLPASSFIIPQEATDALQEMPKEALQIENRFDNLQTSPEESSPVKTSLTESAWLRDFQNSEQQSSEDAKLQPGSKPVSNPPNTDGVKKPAVKSTKPNVEKPPRKGIKSDGSGVKSGTQRNLERLSTPKESAKTMAPRDGYMTIEERIAAWLLAKRKEEGPWTNHPDEDLIDEPSHSRTRLDDPSILLHLDKTGSYGNGISRNSFTYEEHQPPVHDFNSHGDYLDDSLHAYHFNNGFMSNGIFPSFDGGDGMRNYVDIGKTKRGPSFGKDRTSPGGLFDKLESRRGNKDVAKPHFTYDYDAESHYIPSDIKPSYPFFEKEYGMEDFFPFEGLMEKEKRSQNAKNSKKNHPKERETNSFYTLENYIEEPVTNKETKNVKTAAPQNNTTRTTTTKKPSAKKTNNSVNNNSNSKKNKGKVDSKVTGLPGNNSSNRVSNAIKRNVNNERKHEANITTLASNSSLNESVKVNASASSRMSAVMKEDTDQHLEKLASKDGTNASAPNSNQTTQTVLNESSGSNPITVERLHDAPSTVADSENKTSSGSGETPRDQISGSKNINESAGSGDGILGQSEYGMTADPMNYFNLTVQSDTKLLQSKQEAVVSLQNATHLNSRTVFNSSLFDESIQSIQEDASNLTLNTSHLNTSTSASASSSETETVLIAQAASKQTPPDFANDYAHANTTYLSTQVHNSSAAPANVTDEYRTEQVTEKRSLITADEYQTEQVIEKRSSTTTTTTELNAAIKEVLNLTANGTSAADAIDTISLSLRNGSSFGTSETVMNVEHIAASNESNSMPALNATDSKSLPNSTDDSSAINGSIRSHGPYFTSQSRVETVTPVKAGNNNSTLSVHPSPAATGPAPVGYRNVEQTYRNQDVNYVKLFASSGNNSGVPTDSGSQFVKVGSNQTTEAIGGAITSADNGSRLASLSETKEVKMKAEEMAPKGTEREEKSIANEGSQNHAIKHHNNKTEPESLRSSEDVVSSRLEMINVTVDSVHAVNASVGNVSATLEMLISVNESSVPAANTTNVFLTVTSISNASALISQAASRSNEQKAQNGETPLAPTASHIFHTPQPERTANNNDAITLQKTENASVSLIRENEGVDFKNMTSVTERVFTTASTNNETNTNHVGAGHANNTTEPSASPQEKNLTTRFVSDVNVSREMFSVDQHDSINSNEHVTKMEGGVKPSPTAYNNDHTTVSAANVSLSSVILGSTAENNIYIESNTTAANNTSAHITQPPALNHLPSINSTVSVIITTSTTSSSTTSVVMSLPEALPNSQDFPVKQTEDHKPHLEKIGDSLRTLSDSTNESLSDNGALLKSHVGQANTSRGEGIEDIAPGSDSHFSSNSSTLNARSENVTTNSVSETSGGYHQLSGIFTKSDHALNSSVAGISAAASSDADFKTSNTTGLSSLSESPNDAKRNETAMSSDMREPDVNATSVARRSTDDNVSGVTKGSYRETTAADFNSSKMTDQSAMLNVATTGNTNLTTLDSGKANETEKLQQSDTTVVSEMDIPPISAYMIQDFSLRKPTTTDPKSSKDDSKAGSKTKSGSAQSSGDGAKVDKNQGGANASSANNDSSSNSVREAPCLGPACDLSQLSAVSRSQAAVSAVLTSHFGPAKDIMIPFDLELLDLSDNYDNSTGMFICTVPGTYVISLYLMSHPGAKVNARIFVNNRPIAALWADDSKNAGFYPSSSTQTIAQLGFGDQVYVMLVDGGYGDSWVHANYNVFTIFLLYEQMF